MRLRDGQVKSRETLSDAEVQMPRHVTQLSKHDNGAAQTAKVPGQIYQCDRPAAKCLNCVISAFRLESL